ncbi:Sec-independent protein translocase subunit TatA [Paramicrobacterium agarici]|uniref:Sec-independent protein translocase protein TatA n=1 Tax=Paramicrobacterium agarici TaxID=630514 RepID=A0A2A9DZR2_9MICO|nr:Sec-independent protein translocase subunit TatA [Microbacterium agarici]PFG31410.1 sec-independent protein translocase protein TatA [Microbacterium agarici]TQO21297.1 sec-independent protein translocase protein TatA [Microbacterium agarici]
MLGNLNGWHLVIILFLVLLLFGAPKLPGLARSVGQSMKIFKSEIKNNDDESQSGETRPSTDDAQKKTTTSSETASTPEKPTDDPTPKS